MGHAMRTTPLLRSVWSTALLTLCFMTVSGRTAEIVEAERSFTVRTARLEATVADGMIVGLKSLRSNEVHADADARDNTLPVGLGHLTGDPEKAARLHGPWSTHPPAKTHSSFPTMHRPCDNSRYETTRIDNGIRAKWTGLSNGADEFPDETLEVTVWEEPATGHLCYRASGHSAAAGVYGVQIPLANLHADHAFYVPSFGGVRYDRNMNPGLITLGGTPFWEAPVVGVEGRTGSLAVWTQDDQFHPNFCFLNWSGKTFSLAIEHLNLMPFEPHTEVRSVTWYLDVFDGGWVDAMSPYRDWYASLFADEIAARAAVSWADRIRVVIDHWNKDDPENLKTIAGLFDPETVLFHEWNARAPQFDHELPDWTPRAGYADRVSAIQSLGFRTMAYVNTYCVNYNSPVFRRDNIRQFGLTRKIRSFHGYTAPPQTFDTAGNGQLLYLDPLSSRWRSYHTDMMIRWRQETKTDANYEDVGGTIGDFGNGIVEGKFAAQGGVEQFRELLKRNPTVPMASEYAPGGIAFAVRWPLRFQQVWGSDKTRERWMTSQRPVSAYIHGPRHMAWVPTIRAESNFLRHVVVACADALGGLAQVPGDTQSLQSNQGILAHMKYRAQLFSREQFEPAFTRERLAPDVACQYKDRAGRIYNYQASETVQRMTGPEGRELYARVTGLNRFETELSLPGWPAVNDGVVLGLDPAVRYALIPAGANKPVVQITELPAGVKVSRYYETEQFILLVLDPVDAETELNGSVSLKLAESFHSASLNDNNLKLPTNDNAEPVPGQLTCSTSFPARFVFFKTPGQSLGHDEYAGNGKETGRFVLVNSGLDRGGDYVPKHRANFRVPVEEKPVPFTFINYGSDAEVVIDYPVRVPDKNSSLRIYQQNRSIKYGNASIGRLYINGRLVRAYDFGPRPDPDWREGMPESGKSHCDTEFHAWTVPVGNLAGKTIVVSVATDAKASNNSDNHWWSRPKFVSDPDQTAAWLTLSKGGPQPEDNTRVVGP